MSQYLTRREVAQWLELHPSTIYRWGKAGILTEYKLPTGRVRYSLQEVQDLIEGMTVLGTRHGQ